MRIFFDTEFTGLSQDTRLISLGCITEDGRQFYAELTDFYQEQVNDWIQENVISKLHLRDLQNSEWGFEDFSKYPGLVQAKGPKDYIRMSLSSWLEDFGEIEMWGDVLAYDWVLFCNLFGGAMCLPGNIYYIPFDVSTLLKLAGINPDHDRSLFWDGGGEAKRHDALWDAMLTKKAYQVALEKLREYGPYLMQRLNP